MVKRTEACQVSQEVRLLAERALRLRSAQGAPPPMRPSPQTRDTRAAVGFGGGDGVCFHNILSRCQDLD